MPRSVIVVLAALVLQACAAPVKEAAIVAAEPITVEPEPLLERAEICEPGPDDGIGGTGCEPLIE